MSAAALGLFGAAGSHSEPEPAKPQEPAAAATIGAKLPTGGYSLQAGIRW